MSPPETPAPRQVRVGRSIARRRARAVRDGRRTASLARELLRPAAVPTALVLLLVAAYVLVADYAGGSPWTLALSDENLHYALLRCGGKSNALITNGEYWRLLTAVFLHGSPVHLLVNVVGVCVLGKLAENGFGRRRTFALFVFSGIGATAASYLLSEALSVGASGAVFGLLGAVGVLLVKLRGELAPATRRLALLAAAVWLASALAVGLLLPAVDDAAHLGGLLAGALLGLLFPTERPPARASANVLAFLSVVALAGSAVLAAHSALAELPPATPRLAPFLAAGGLPAPLDWRAGRLVGNQCLSRSSTSPDASPEAAADGAPWCFIDGYDTVVVIGDAERLFPGQEEVVARLRAAAGPLPPEEQVGEADALFAFPVGGGVAYVVACYAELAERYRPLAWALYERVAGAAGAP